MIFDESWKWCRNSWTAT